MFFFDILMSFIKSHPGLVLTNMSFMLLMPVNEVLLPHLYGKIVDEIQHQKSFIYHFVLAIIVLAIIYIGYGLGDLHDTILNPEFQSYMRQAMLSSIIDKYENCYEDIALGEVITKFVKAPGIIIQWFSRVKDYVIPYILIFFTAVVYFLYYDIVLGLNLFITITLICYLLIKAPYDCMEKTVLKSKVYNQLHEEIDDTLRNLISVYGSDQKYNELARLAVLDKTHKEAFMATMKCVMKYKFIAVPIIITFFTIFIFRSNTLIRNKKLKPASFVSLFMIILFMLGSLTWVIDIMRDILFDWGMIKETDTLLQFDKTPPDHLYPDVAPPENGIGLYNVSFKYTNANDYTLKDITIHFKPGENTALLGDIGSGKTTLLKMMMRLYLPNKGDLFINNQWYSHQTTYQIRRSIGYVPQNPILFNRSIYDNIKYGNDISNAEIDKIVIDLGISKEFTNLTKGLDTLVGKNGSKLSGGQRQLIWCLRILLVNPEIILLDEPTASMDVKSKDLLFYMLDKIMTKEKTVVMITHDPYLLKKCTNKVFLKNGEISINNTNTHSNNYIYNI